jgi:sucrose-6-phosphate hydrolase SacC (GH32 family)
MALSAAAEPANRHELAHWKFDSNTGYIEDTVSRIHDAIYSKTCTPDFRAGIKGHALWLDGYSAWCSRTASVAPSPSGEFTIEFWAALESYPTSLAAFINQRDRNEAGYFFGLDQFGFLRFGLRMDGSWRECVSSEPIPKFEWMHIAASVDTLGRMSVYRNGTMIGAAASEAGILQLARTVDLLIGKTDGCEYVAGVFPTGMVNGLLDDIVLYNKCLSGDEIRRSCNSFPQTSKPDLAVRPSYFAGDLQRPVYHALPDRAWTNEPHGLIRFEGEYHLYYQKNANGPYWGQINWGHMTSPDLLRWTDQKPVLSPQPGLDAAGCWSGSIIQHQGQLSAIYTAGDGKKPSICIATSEDGSSFSKSPHNPIIAASPAELNHPDFRDPFVWAEGDTFYLIVGSGIPNVGGTALLYKSSDLVHWTFLRKLLQGGKENSGTFWEMPVFFRLGDKHVLIVCEVPGRASYWVGEWKDEQFHPDQPDPRRLEIINQFLSPTPYRDEQGRLIVMGIIPETRSSRETWKAGWAHLYSLPRMLDLDANGSLQQQPLPELATLRKDAFSLANKSVDESAPNLLKPIRGVSLEIRGSFSRGSAKRTGFRLRRTDDAQEETRLYYDWTNATITLDRTRSSLNPDVARTIQTGAFSLGPDELLDLHVFIDHSVLEVFVNGRGHLTSRVYPTRRDSDGINIFCEGGTCLFTQLTTWAIKPA